MDEVKNLTKSRVKSDPSGRLDRIETEMFYLSNSIDMMSRQITSLVQTVEQIKSNLTKVILLAAGLIAGSNIDFTNIIKEFYK